MANDRRPQMDYYEYKRRYEAVRRAQGAPETQAPDSPEPEEKAKRGLFGGIRQAVSSLGARGEAPEDELSAQQARDVPEADEEIDDEELSLDEEEDERQIDNPFADAAQKVRQFGGKLAGLGARIKNRRQRGDDEDEQTQTSAEPSGVPQAAPAAVSQAAPDDAPQAAPVDIPQAEATDVMQAAPSDVPQDEAADIPQAEAADIPQAEAADVPQAEAADVPQAEAADVPQAAPADIPQAEEETAPRRLSRKEKKAIAPEQAGQATEQAVQATEQTPATGKKSQPKPKRRKGSSIFGSPGRLSANQAEDDDEYDDIAPTGGGIRLFGRRARKQAEEAEELDTATVEDLDAAPADDEPERSPYAPPEEQAPGEQTSRDLKKADEEEPVPSRRARKRRAARQEPEPPATDEGEEEPVDEPTQQFRPLRKAKREEDQRTRRFRPVRRAPEPEPEPEDDDDYEDEYDDEDDVPVRGYARRGAGRMRVYRDEDLDDDEDENYDEDNPYDEDYDDTFDEDEDKVGFGKRLLRFLRALLIIALVLALAVLALRQMEASGRLSLDILRTSIGVVVPLDKVFPTPDLLPDITPSPENTPMEVIPAVTAQPEPASDPTNAPMGVALDAAPNAGAPTPTLPAAVG